jgi:hypothetical protein
VTRKSTTISLVAFALGATTYTKPQSTKHIPNTVAKAAITLSERLGAVWVKCPQYVAHNGDRPSFYSDFIYRISDAEPRLAMWIEEAKQLTPPPCDGPCTAISVTPTDVRWTYENKSFTGWYDINRVTGEFSGQALDKNDNLTMWSGKCSKIDDPTVGVHPAF